MTEQTAFGVVEREAGFVAGGFDAEDKHEGSLALPRCEIGNPLFGKQYIVYLVSLSKHAGANT